MNTVKNILLALIMLSISAFAQINLNTATKEELMSLKGIGESKAEAIMEYRKMNKFNSIEDLKNVNGIGDKTFKALKQDISVSGKSIIPANATKKIKDKEDKLLSKTKDTKEKTTKQADKLKDTKDSLNKKAKDKEDSLKKETKKAKSKEGKADKAKDAKENIKDTKENIKKDTKKTKESK